jgi:ABC-type Fe3+ transport system substrate-binding protein
MTRWLPWVAAFGVLLAAPMLVRPTDAPQAPPRDAPHLVVLTPQTEQIREEFAQAFRAWHEARFGTPVEVVWSTPGGAVDIRRMLLGAWESRLRQGLAVGGDADVVFGGGSYEFELLKREVVVRVGDAERRASVLEPVELPREVVDACFPAPVLAGQRLYDPQGYWYGTALASFGIVWNGPALERLGVPRPERWSALADARLRGWVTMVNPAQSGSVLSAFESIVQRVGWRSGLALLRRAAANARTFAPSGTRGPVDVAAGDAAMAVSIDFYGRYQAQAIADAARAHGVEDAPVIGFTLPRGESAVDPDPVGVLRNAPHREIAVRFVTFCLGVEAQRLWQGRAGTAGGPRRFELRRMPIMRSLYEREPERFVDAVDPFVEASAPMHPDPAMRAFLPTLFQAMAMDCHEALRAAWQAIVSHPAYPLGRGGVVTADEVQDAELRGWLERFDALPEVPTPEGPRSIGDPAALRALQDGWLRGGWAGRGLWHPEDRPADALRTAWRAFFLRNLESIVAEARRKGLS